MGWHRVDICYKLVLFYHSCNIFFGCSNLSLVHLRLGNVFLVRVVEMIAIQG